LTHIYLIRHAPTLWNEQELFQGVGLSIPLSDEGRQQASHLAAKFRKIQLDTILCSPARRTVETVLPLAVEQGLVPILDDDLVERDHGGLIGTSFADIPDVFDYFYHNNNRERGEPMEKLYERAGRVRRRILTQYTGRRLAVMSHGGLLSVLCCQLNEEPLEYKQEHVLSNGRIHYYHVDPEGHAVQVKLGLETPPLPE